MNFDKEKIKQIIKADMDMYTEQVDPGWTKQTILLDAMDQSFQMDGEPMFEVARQIKSSGESWNNTLKDQTASVLLEAGKELFDSYYPSLWTQMKPVIETPLMLTMEIMPSLLE